jgi:hypothetical protein
MLFPIVLIGVLMLAPRRCTAQSSPGDMGHSAAAVEPSNDQKIAELKAAKKKLERQARETTGYHESFRQMKVIKIDQLIKQLENGEDVPQSKIDKTIGHMAFPLYNPHN